MHIIHYKRYVSIYVCVYSPAALFMHIPQSVLLRQALRQIEGSMLLKLNTTVEKQTGKLPSLTSPSDS